jgi:hypothetical protein
MYEAKVIADSTCNGQRLTTLQVCHPRIVHAELNTHCAFARNASSSRAIPFSKMVERVMTDPFIPRRFGINQAGMQAFSYLEGMAHEAAVSKWLQARDRAVEIAMELADPLGLNIHKQIANRLLEPWMWITVCVTGDWGAWSNYFALRCHPDAEDNIQQQAYMAQLEYFRSKPRVLHAGDWHLPYVSAQDFKDLTAGIAEKKPMKMVEVSVGRVARTSYLTQEGKRDFEEDVKLHDRLVNHRPMHSSPLEQVCLAMGDGRRYNKYIGWKAYRHMIPGEYVTDFKPNHKELQAP